MENQGMLFSIMLRKNWFSSEIQHMLFVYIHTLLRFVYIDIFGRHILWKSHKLDFET